VSLNPIHVVVDADLATVALRGEHEAYSADKIARHLNALIDEGLSVVVDLREAAFIDSTVVGVLLAARRRAEEHGVSVDLQLGRGTGWPVRRLLEVTGLEEQLHVVD
jgi:anti-anti-sigma factor